MSNYKLRKDLSINVYGRTLFRIEATKDITIHNVSKGDLGGYVESENNLFGDAWVFGDAKVYGNARVYDDAKVSGNARVYDDAKVFGDAWVYNDAEVCGDAKVFGDAWVYNDAWVYDDAKVSGDAKVYGNAWVFGNAWVYDDAEVYGNAWVFGDAKVYGNARVSGDAKVCGDKIDNNKDIYNICCNETYNITLTPNFIKIGCQFHKKEEWFNFTDREIEAMDGLKAIRFWKKWKPILKAICDKNEEDV